MRVLIFEQWGGGHYTNYLAHLVPKICELASEVTLAISPTFYHSDGFQRVRSSWPSNNNLHFDLQVPEANPTLPLRERLNVLVNLRQAISRSKPEYLFLPSGDAQTITLGLARPFCLGNLSLNTNSECILHWGYGPGAMAFKPAMKRLIYDTAFSWSSWTRLNFVNCLQYEALSRRGIGGRIAMIPDPVPEYPSIDRNDARRRIGLPEDGRIIGFVGTMDNRKAIPELLNAFRNARLSATDRLVLIGRMTTELATLIAREYLPLQESGRLIVIDRWVTETELQDANCALDVACLPYYDFPSLSSLMLKAISARRPVLVHDFGWMRAIAKRFAAGSVCNIHETESFSSAIESALEHSADYTPTLPVQALIDYHSPSNFVEHSVVTLRSLLGKPSTQPLTNWESVLSLLEPQQRYMY